MYVVLWIVQGVRQILPYTHWAKAINREFLSAFGKVENVVMPTRNYLQGSHKAVLAKFINIKPYASMISIGVGT